MSNEEKSYIPHVVGGLLGAGIVGGGLALANPYIRKNLVHLARNIGDIRKAERAVAPPKRVAATAKKIADSLRAGGLDLSKARVGVSGVGGSGKSTLAKALSKELNYKVKFLDEADVVFRGRDIPKFLKSHPAGPKTILEQTHLLTQVNPDKFDAIIRVSRPLDVIKKDILKRGRGAGQIPFYDYNKLDNVIQEAFKSTRGVKMSPVAGIEMKIKPKGGFGADRILNGKLRDMGINPRGLDREQKIFSVVEGQKVRIKGLYPLLNKSNLLKGVGGVTGGGAVGIGTGEIVKTSQRSKVWDALAGIDPTGTKTYQYGIEDATKSDREAAKRVTIGVLGGLLGGGLLVPSAITGVIGAAKGAPQGPKGMLAGFIKGLKRPVSQIVGGKRVLKALGKVEKGSKLTMQDIRTLHSVGETLPVLGSMVNKMGLSKAIDGSTKANLIAAATPALLSAVPKSTLSKARSHFQGQINEAVAGLVLSGVVGAGSAGLQYTRGRELGSILTPEQRRDAAK